MMAVVLVVVVSSICMADSGPIAFERDRTVASPGYVIFYGAITDTSYVADKAIPFKLYMPHGTSVVPAAPRGVVVFAHGAGANRDVATGYHAAGSDEYFDGLVRYWAARRYVVICPTLRKMRPCILMRQVFGTWEGMRKHDSLRRTVGDFVGATFAHPREYFATRVRDIAFIRGHLDEICGAPYVAEGCGDGTTFPESIDSLPVGIAGHSMGALTTFLAAGAKLALPGRDDLLDLAALGALPDGETYTFSRGPSGAFVDADAYLLISAGMKATTPELVEDGRDLIQKPLMILTGTHDIVQDSRYLNPVTVATGKKASSSYGVVFARANHITPVSEFAGMAAWDPVMRLGLKLFEWNRTAAPKTIEHAPDTGDWLDWAVTSTKNSKAGTMRERQLRLLDGYQTYSTAFWDAYLGAPDKEREEARAFLAAPAREHVGDPRVAAYARKP